LATLISVIVNTDWDAASEAVTEVPQVVEMPLHDPVTGEPTTGSTSYIAKALFEKDGGFVLPFEIASVLLLAALIGAVVLVRHKEKD
jgi:NADH:ubiquinone oxidoreductase subunit 6 (subunit J)